MFFSYSLFSFKISFKNFIIKSGNFIEQFSSSKRNPVDFKKSPNVKFNKESIQLIQSIFNSFLLESISFL